ncbi:unnamed protein product [Oncorhynchus mykiss]|uniref:Reverse transcriptase domain-containing protein n=1 Tax=Oncorhynchus mykiss TaxID=8022 RepID=A0A060Z115_ONCMY|nr:unnamed protein product [Oncorhynchus mykiss]
MCPCVCICIHPCVCARVSSQATAAWERTARLIQQRESLLARLEMFDKDASDPNRFFLQGYQGTSLARLDESKHRSILNSQICSLEMVLSKILHHITDSFHDTVTYKGRPYREKMRNTVTTDKSTIIENFNKHFSTAGHAFHLATPTPVNSTAPPTATRPSLPHFSFSQIQSADVLKELQNLDPFKSAGLDNLDPFFLKLSAEIVATPITSLFNLSFVSSEIPKDWKAAAVIPLFKVGDTLDPNCYRPISILPCLSKVFESQVNKQITDHFESHHTLSAMQSGFRAGHGS